MIKFIITLAITVSFCSFSEARIRLRKVKEAPKVCKLMDENAFLSRDGKKVFGTLRYSLVLETSAETNTVSVVKDKGEKVCLWTGEEWNQVLKNNGAENLIGFKYHIDEYKDILFPYVQKADGSYFMIKIPFTNCQLTDQVTTEKLELPRCEPPKKAKKRRSSKSSTKKNKK